LRYDYLEDLITTRILTNRQHKLPDSVHDTGSNHQTGKVSHATGDSKVPHVRLLPSSYATSITNLNHRPFKKASRRS
jgi:hypothetical protein